MFRKLRGKYSAHAFRLSIRPHMSWHWQGLLVVALIIVLTGLAWWVFENGRKSGGFDRGTSGRQVDALTTETTSLTSDNDQLRSTVEGLQRQSLIDKAAQAELAKSVTQLQEENARLKEEVGFFRSIMSAGKLADGLSVQNFRIEPDVVPNEYRYHMLLVQGGSRDGEFVGKAQLVLGLEKDGAPALLTLHEDDKSVEPLVVRFKYYQRLDGRFKLRPGTVIKSANLQVIEKSSGQVKLSRTLVIS
jgi:cell division protein FtsB